MAHKNNTSTNRRVCIAITSGTDSCKVSAVKLISAMPPGIMPNVKERESSHVSHPSPAAAAPAIIIIKQVDKKLRAKKPGAYLKKDLSKKHPRLLPIINCPN
ncbi:hypothetical protein D3C87_1934340 [compost metagenome]